QTTISATERNGSPSRACARCGELFQPDIARRRLCPICASNQKRCSTCGTPHARTAKTCRACYPSRRRQDAGHEASGTSFNPASVPDSRDYESYPEYLEAARVALGLGREPFSTELGLGKSTLAHV